MTSIGNGAFEGCPRLSSINIPNSVTSIGSYAFEGCNTLTSFIIPEGVTIIREGTFYGCRYLNSVSIPNSVTEIGAKAFFSCWALASVTIPNSVTSIGSNAFCGCTRITSLIIPEGVTIIKEGTFESCGALKSVAIPNSVTDIGERAFLDCKSLASVTIPNNVTEIRKQVFTGCIAIETIILPEEIKEIGYRAFGDLPNLKDIYCHATTVPKTDNAFRESDLPKATLHVPAASIAEYEAKSPWNQFGTIVPLETQPDYRPMVEDGKVWKVGGVGTNPVQLVEYYYFDGDTIVDGKACKQMMRQRYVCPEHPDYDDVSQYPDLSYAGAWYEEDQRVYAYDSIANQFKLMYDFSLADNGTFLMDGLAYVLGPRQTGGIQGFKGVYRDVRLWADGDRIYSPTWLEGVGSIDGPTINVYPGYVDPAWFLMSCTLDDEVVYLNDEMEDGATPEGSQARNRFDFTHTIKTQPKVPMRREAEKMLYGEYGEQLLSINLDPLGDTYRVRITDETGKAVYEKTVNASNIVGLSINISAYPKGRYTVVVENSQESFVGEFETRTTGIEEIDLAPALARGEKAIFNLQGQRIGSLQKGLNIVNGQKVLGK